MKKRLIVIAIIAVLILSSMASAGIFDRIRARLAPMQKADLPAVAEDIEERVDMRKLPAAKAAGVTSQL